MTAKNGRLFDAPVRRKVIETTKNGAYQEVTCPSCEGSGKVAITRSDVLNAEEIIPLASQILYELSQKYGVTVGDLVGDRRFKRLLEPRFIAFWRMRHQLGMTLDAIGAVMHRDHSSVIHGMRFVDASGNYTPTRQV